MDATNPLPSAPLPANAGRWMLLVAGEGPLPPPSRPLPAPAPAPTPTPPAPLAEPVPFREGTCPSCHRIVRLWLTGHPPRTDRHDPGCPYQGAAGSLLQAWGVDPKAPAG